jgi:hypothetical protein
VKTGSDVVKVFPQQQGGFNSTTKEIIEMHYDEFLEQVKERHSTLSPHDIYANLQRFQFVPEAGSLRLSPLKFDNPGSTGDSQLDFLPPRLSDVSLSVHALKQLCARLEVPYTFLGRCPEQLQYLMMNYFIQHGGYDQEVMLRTIQHTQVRAIMSERYTPCDDVDLFPLLEPWVKDTDVSWYSFDDYSTHVRLTLPGTEAEIKVGDAVQQGIHITNSEVGVRSVTIQAVVIRLVCQNGLLSTSKKSRSHVGDPKRLEEHVKYMIEEAVLDSDALLIKYRQSLAVAIDDPTAALKQLVQTEGLSQTEFSQLLQVYLAAPEPSLFGLVNALTQAAQEYPADRRWELEKIAGRLLDSGC